MTQRYFWMAGLACLYCTGDYFARKRRVYDPEHHPASAAHHFQNTAYQFAYSIVPCATIAWVLVPRGLPLFLLSLAIDFAILFELSVYTGKPKYLPLRTAGVIVFGLSLLFEVFLRAGVGISHLTQ